MPFSPLCQLNGGCMGCCGHDFESKEKIEVAIESNTQEFLTSNPQSKHDFATFRDRANKWDLRNGVCRNLVNTNGCVHCPLHPAIHGEDLRKDHCDINYLCKTAKTFARWQPSKQEAFISFILEKNLDAINYSLLMDKGKLLAEFSTKYL